VGSCHLTQPKRGDTLNFDRVKFTHFLFFPIYSLLWFGYDYPSEASVLNDWSPAGGAILQSSGNQEVGLGRGSRSLEVGP
jgi:hypothetical protein